MTRSTEQQATAASGSTANPFAELIALGNQTASRHAFFTKYLQLIGRTLKSPYALISLRSGTEVIEDDYHQGPTDPKFWKSTLSQFVKEGLLTEADQARARRYSQKNGKLKVVFLSAPITNGTGDIIGAIGVTVASVQQVDIPKRLALLESLTRLASYVASQLQRNNQTNRSDDQATQQALTQASQYESAEALAFSITNSLRNRLNCEQVALAVVKHGHVRILSISGLDEVSKNSQMIRHIKQAMEECLDAQEVVQCTADALTQQHRENYYLHEQWRAATMGDSVASLPLVADGDTQAIVSLRYGAELSLSQERLTQVKERVQAFVPALRLSEKASRGIVRHVWDVCLQVASHYTSTGNRPVKLITALAGLGLLFFAFGKTEYHLTVPARIVPARTYHITAPFEGTLHSSQAIEGQQVQAHQLLCTLDQTDLRQRQSELSAEIRVLDHEIDRARAQHKPANVEILRSKQRVMQARLAGIEHQLQQASIRAPVDGLIVSGDLQEHLGSVVSRGQLFFEIAASTQWKVELEVPEADMELLNAGLGGYFVLNARPDEQTNLLVNLIRPDATIRNERNVFVAEADIDLPESWVRPGMEGVAKVSIGRKPIWWAAFHRVIDSLRISMWL